MQSFIHSYQVSKQNFLVLVCKIFLQRFIPEKKLHQIHSLGFCESNKVGANFQFARLPQLIPHTIGW